MSRTGVAKHPIMALTRERWAALDPANRWRAKATCEDGREMHGMWRPAEGTAKADLDELVSGYEEMRQRCPSLVPVTSRSIEERDTWPDLPELVSAPSRTLPGGMMGADAQAKLDAIIAHCRKRADEHNRKFGMGVWPQDMKVDVRDIFAIIGDDPTATASPPPQAAVPGAQPARLALDDFNLPVISVRFSAMSATAAARPDLNHTARPSGRPIPAIHLPHLRDDFHLQIAGLERYSDINRHAPVRQLHRSTIRAQLVARFPGQRLHLVKQPPQLAPVEAPVLGFLSSGWNEATIRATTCRRMPCSTPKQVRDAPRRHWP